jgi:hypothetical protein
LGRLPQLGQSFIRPPLSQSRLCGVKAAEPPVRRFAEPFTRGVKLPQYQPADG